MIGPVLCYLLVVLLAYGIAGAAYDGVDATKRMIDRKRRS
jgi:hypothetical protein